jgi:2-oxo-4-hydroxy-4-carboxy--5-ureidoimidazoline (OHCU) decarboxylase
MTSKLQPLPKTLSSPEDLKDVLDLLFETSPVISELLVPQLQALPRPPSSYHELITLSIDVISSWNLEDQAQFIYGHPRIGEVKNLSALSAQEQARVATPPDVLVRLEHLNTCYERRYPGLRYIIFVNGRSRAEIIPEIEALLGFDHCLEPGYPPSPNVTPAEFGGKEWTSELRRAVTDIGLIAEARLQSLGVRDEDA